MKVAQSLNIENCKIFLKKFERDTKWMEEYTMNRDWKTQDYRVCFSFLQTDRFKAIPIKKPDFFLPIYRMSLFLKEKSVWNI